MSELDEAIDKLDMYDGNAERASVARVELATLRANQLPANVVAAVRAYQEVWRKQQAGDIKYFRKTNAHIQMLDAIEADAKGFV